MKHIITIATVAVALTACGSSGGDDDTAAAEATTPTTQPGPADNLAEAVQQCTESVPTDYQAAIDAMPAIYRQVIQGVANKEDITLDQLIARMVTQSYDADEQTLSIEGAFETDDDDDVTPTGLLYGLLYQCILPELDTPTRVTDHIGHTRALDGTQTDAWGDYEARWNFHPDNGTNLTIWVP